MPMHSVNLDELENTEHNVVIHDVKYPVRAMTPRIAYAIDGARQVAEHAERPGAFYDAVHKLVPDMPRDLMDDLNYRQVLKIVAIANFAVRAVDEAAAPPNGPSSAPAEATPATEPSDLTETPLVAC